jgi:putative ABC transport system ATP-binding protein
VPAIEAVNVSKTYNRVDDVLDDVNLAANPGEIVVLMGRSGSGKTTLLNLLAGLEQPTDGQVLLEGTDLASMNETARRETRLERIGVVFQRFHLMPELTVRENVALPMQLANRESPDDRAVDLLEFFGLGHRVDAFPATLSGGETQRAAIARALGNQPAVVLADEPTASLDADNARNALDALEQVAEDIGTSVVIASHDPMCKQVADRLLHLSDGELVPEKEAETVEFTSRGGGPQPAAGSDANE